MSQQMNRAEFARLINEVLPHLYDHVYLQLHPLAQRLTPATDSETSGLTLHRVLVEAIENLRPPAHIPPTNRSWRPYLSIYLRYVEGMDIQQVSEEIGISPRQMRRERSRALEVLSEILWKRHLRLLSGTAQATETQTEPEVEDELANGATNSEISRLGAGVPDDSRTKVNSVLEGVRETLADLITRQNVDLMVDLPANLPETTVDRVVLRQILLNILTHLLDLGPNGAITITGRPQKPHLALSIYYRGETPINMAMTEEDNRLTVAHRLAEMQEGQMKVSGNGDLSIDLILPVHQQINVLVIDDNPDLIQLFGRYLSNSAYQLSGATTSREARHLAQEIQPQVIILDVMMPDQDGWELMQYLKNHPTTKDIPIIVCSVLKERELALSLGAREFLAKPVTRQTLLTALARLG